MFFKKKNAKASAQREKVMELQIQRDMVKKNIRHLRGEMKELIDQAANADDLDRKILSLEYDEKKMQLDNETAHFNELSRMIIRLNSVALVHERNKATTYMSDVADTIDTDSLLKADDEMTARRKLMQDDADALDDVLNNNRMQMEEIGESAEFSRLVLEKQLKNKSESREAAAAEPVAAQTAEAVCNS